MSDPQQERELLALVSAIREAQSLRPLAQMLDGDGGTERSAEALRTLAEFDLDVLVDCTLRTVAETYGAGSRD